MNVVFCGMRTAGVECLKFLLKEGHKVTVVTNDDTQDVRWSDSVYEYAISQGLAMTVNPDWERLAVSKPDALLSVYYNKIIPETMLNVCKLRINFHGGELPKYRGRCSNVWTIFNGETESFATAHIIEKSVDTGPIIDKEKVLVDDDETGKSLYDKISDATIILFKRVVKDLKNARPIKAQDGIANTYSKLPNDGFISLSWGTAQTLRFVRAMNFLPFKPAQLTIREKDNNVVAYVYGARAEKQRNLCEDDVLVLTNVRFLRI